MRCHRTRRGQLPPSHPEDGVPEGGRPHKGLRFGGLLGHSRGPRRAGRAPAAQAHIGDRHVSHVLTVGEVAQRPSPQNLSDSQHIQVRDQDDQVIHQGQGDTLLRGTYLPCRRRGCGAADQGGLCDNGQGRQGPLSALSPGQASGLGQVRGGRVHHRRGHRDALHAHAPARVHTSVPRELLQALRYQIRRGGRGTSPRPSDHLWNEREARGRDRGHTRR